jgi:hypothetical protein
MIVLSASKIATYLQCPRKYRFRYVARVRAPWKPSALALGSAVHAALETFHRQRAAGASMAPVAVGALFRIEWACELVDEISFHISFRVWHLLGRIPLDHGLSVHLVIDH